MLLALIAIFIALPANAVQLAGRVVGVLDGDTVDLLSEDNVLTRIRLSGIDAPEKSQPHGKVSKKQLSDQIFGKSVVAEGRKHDRYGRLVAKIEFAGRDINLSMVKAGLAWHYKKYAKEQIPDDVEIYAAAEDKARQQRIGLWADDEPVPPWNFRRARREGHSKPKE